MNVHTYATHALMEITTRPPAVFVKGEGSWLWDHDGKRYLDLVQGSAVKPPVLHGLTSSNMRS